MRVGITALSGRLCFIIHNPSISLRLLLKCRNDQNGYFPGANRAASLDVERYTLSPQYAMEVFIAYCGEVRRLACY